MASLVDLNLARIATPTSAANKAVITAPKVQVLEAIRAPVHKTVKAAADGNLVLPVQAVDLVDLVPPALAVDSVDHALPEQAVDLVDHALPEQAVDLVDHVALEVPVEPEAALVHRPTFRLLEKKPHAAVTKTKNMNCAVVVCKTRKKTARHVRKTHAVLKVMSFWTKKFILVQKAKPQAPKMLSARFEL